MQAARIDAPQPPLLSEKGILFQLEALESKILRDFIQVLPGALPDILEAHFL